MWEGVIGGDRDLVLCIVEKLERDVRERGLEISREREREEMRSGEREDEREKKRLIFVNKI